jgi:hypothetical protein
LPCRSGSLSSFGGFVGVDGREFAINVGELAFEVVLLVEKVIGAKPRATAIDGGAIRGVG